MATTRGGGVGGGSASRVGDGDVDLRDRWDWGAIPRLLSSACLFVCSGWVAASLVGMVFSWSLIFHPLVGAEGCLVCLRNVSCLQSIFVLLYFSTVILFFSNCLHDQTPSEQSRGCFGCCDKAVKQLGELSRNLITHDQIPIAEPFWSTTTIEVEPSDLRGSFINTSNWGFDQHGTGSSHNLPELGNNGLALWEQTRQEWTEIRSLRPKVKQVREPVLRYARTKWPFNMQKNPTKLCHITFSAYSIMLTNTKFLCSWNAAYESLLGSNKPFAQPIPLHVRSNAFHLTIIMQWHTASTLIVELQEMVDFLVDIWEQEGLYD
ncbi:hypothetical protein HU200_055691 [Digitaria exilis]|uniref:Gag1-like clamp domain-containing protein n=1 Tax=Digitaria exilis TaxID=1010633 RepID=A0A835ASS4_9POAL|nr:hypothetical protein HU200_055691 [Digitaria exilis]